MGKRIGRKHYLMNPKFQFSIISWFCFLLVLVLFIFAVANWSFFNELATIAKSSGITEGHIFFDYLEEQKVLMFKIFLTASFVAFIAILLGGIYLSHRISGPIYKLTMTLNEAELGALKKIYFRRNDYFPELNEAYNSFVERVSSPTNGS